MLVDKMEAMEQRLEDEGVVVDYDILRNRATPGLYAGGNPHAPPVIMINHRLTGRERRCVLAEEAGHHYRSAGPALDATDVTQRKNELAGREWAYAELVPLADLVMSWRRGNRTVYDLAEDLDVTEDFLRAALDYYHRKHGVLATWGKWIVQFDPYFSIYKDG